MAHLSLFELNSLIKRQLQDHLETNYWVVAEISEMRENPKGHCYMELIEKQGNFIQAKIRANIWAYTYRSLKYQFLNATGTELKSGMRALFNISINFHEVYGMSLTVNDIDPNFTIGERSRLKEETIRKLKEEDYLDLNKRLELPVVPQNIAIISSKTAAGHGDFLDQLLQNSYGFDFNVETFQTVMQGNEVLTSMTKSLEQIREAKSKFDLIVIIRGGGAQADLDSFDTYELAKLVAAAPLPVLTGIGHERDETVVDLVAHTKLKTPTAVAEFLISGMNRFYSSLYDLNIRLERSTKERLRSANDQLQSKLHQIERASDQQLKWSANLLKEKLQTLRFKSERVLERERNKLNNQSEKLRLVDPMTLFKRGYSITLKNGRSINNQIIQKGDILITKTENTELKSEVIEIKDE